MRGVILNPKARYVARHGVDRVRALILTAMPDARIHVLTAGDDVGARCRAFLADGATAVVAAGGDGTVGSVAAHLLGTETPLGVFPVGTLNHFARDVGVGRDVELAAHALARTPREISIDSADVNGRLFLNNSSIGLYAHIVQIRERHEQQWGKLRALTAATLLSLREGRPCPVLVTTNGESVTMDTFLLFVGNNQYDVDLLRMGRRSTLDAGELSLFVLAETRRRRLMVDFAAAARARRARPQLFRHQMVREVTVTPQGLEEVAVACDGEVTRLRPPLVYRVRPRALRVLVPQDG